MEPGIGLNHWKLATKTELSEDKKKQFANRNVKIATAIAYINALFLFLQTEWGTAVLLFAIYLAFLFSSA